MNIKRLTALALSAVLLCGCTEIDYSDYSSTVNGTTASSTDNVSSVPPADITTEYMTEKYENTSFTNQLTDTMKTVNDDGYTDDSIDGRADLM